MITLSQNGFGLKPAYEKYRYALSKMQSRHVSMYRSIPTGGLANRGVNVEIAFIKPERP